jgi:hypothetical protein
MNSEGKVMIRTEQQAAEIFAELNKEEEVDPEEFWAKVGWDFKMIRKIGRLGSELFGLENESLEDEEMLSAMQMGAVLAIKGLERKQREDEEIVI